MDYDHRAYQHRRSKLSCLSLPVIAGVTLLLLIECYMLWVRPGVSEYIGHQVSTQLELPGDAPSSASPVAALPGGPGTEEHNALPAPTSILLLPMSPTPVAVPASGEVTRNGLPAPTSVPLPPTSPMPAGIPASGEVTITEQQANAYLAANVAALAPVERMTIRFLPGQVQSDIDVFGTQVRFHSEFTAQDGYVRVVNPRLDGTLGMFVSIEDFVRPLEQQINAQLKAQEQTIQDVQIQQGKMVVLINQM